MAEQNTIKKTLRFITLVLLIIGVFTITAVNNDVLFKSLLPALILLSLSWLMYAKSDFRKNIIGVKFDKINFTRSVVYGLLFGGGFWVITKIIPGMSIGLPTTPNAISTTLRFWLIVLVYPIAEEIFFRGIILGYFMSTNAGRKSKWYAILLSAFIFSIAHLGAYIVGIFDYPDIPQALSSLGQNLGAFSAAFLFGVVVAWFVSKNNIRNLIFAIIFHALLNLIILTSLVVSFI